MTHLKHFILPILLGILVFTACNEDNGIINNPGDPSVSVIDSSPFPFPPGDTAFFSLSASAGDAELNSVEILANGVQVAISDLLVNGAGASANPYLLFNADRDAFTHNIAILTDIEAGETVEYEFLVTDADGQSASKYATITGDASAANPPYFDLNGEVSQSDELLLIPVIGESGNNDLATLTVYEDGVLVQPGRISLGAMTVWSENPYTLPASLENGFDDDLIIELPATTNQYNYTLVLTDTEGLSDTISFTAYLEIGTPVTTVSGTLTLANASGPAGQGGINLLTGAQTNSGSSEAHLKDLGVDLDLPVDQNWVQRVAPGAATTTLKKLSGSPFDGIAYTEEIQTLFESSSDIVSSTGTNEKVVAGDQFVLVTNAGDYIAVSVDDVVITSDDNTDHYVLSIKY